MGGPDGSTQIIWTSSSNAKKDAFCIDDIQHANGSGAQHCLLSFNYFMIENLLFFAQFTCLPAVC
jgi:hypothetical protein